MAVAPLVAMKSTKCESLEAVARELDRRAHTYVNDVDQTRSGLNEVHCCERDGKPLTLDEAVERRVSELHTKRAVRKDAVKAMGFIVSTNDALSDERAAEFLHDAAGWFAKRYGKENMLGYAIHYDEDTPHLHLWLAPVISEDGWDRLCAAKLFTPDKRERFDEEGHKLKKGQKPEKGKVVWRVTERGTMSILQEDFWREVASKYGYDRPLDREKRGKGYRSLEAYKTHVGTTRALRQEVKKAREDATQAQATKNEAERKAGEAQGELDGLGDKITELTTQRNQLKQEVKDLGQAKDEAERAVTRLNTDITLKSGTLKQLKFDVGLEQKRLDELRPEVDDLKKERKQLKDEVSALRKDKTRLEGLVAAARQQACELLWPLVRSVVRLVEKRLDAFRRQPTPREIDDVAWGALVDASGERGHDEQER